MQNNLDNALAEYQAHKLVCTMPYDPNRKRCPECARLIEIVAIELVKSGKEQNDN